MFQICFLGCIEWCYEYLAQYVHSYVAVGIIALVSVGIAAGVFLLVKIAFDRITEKCDDRWQYYKSTGIAELRKAVSVALCVISVTLSMLSVSLIPVDINVLSWWLILSAGQAFSLDQAGGAYLYSQCLWFLAC